MLKNLKCSCCRNPWAWKTSTAGSQHAKDLREI